VAVSEIKWEDLNAIEERRSRLGVIRQRSHIIAALQ
jgi:hypothetical protein